MRRSISMIFLLGILCFMFEGCGAETMAGTSRDVDKSILLVENNDLILYNLGDETQYVIDDTYADGDISADLLSNHAYFSEDGYILAYYSQPGDTYQLNIVDWNEVCKNPENIEPLCIAENAELKFFQMTSSSIGYVADGKCFWYIVDEAQLEEIGIFDVANDYYAISDDGRSILIENAEGLQLYTYAEEKQLHKVYQNEETKLHHLTSDFSRILVSDQMWEQYWFLEYNGWQVSNEELTEEDRLSWGIEQGVDSTDYIGAQLRTDGSDYTSSRILNPDSPIVGRTKTEEAGVIQLFTDGLVPFDTSLQQLVGGGQTYDKTHSVFYVVDVSPKQGNKLYAYQLDKSLVVKETLVAERIKSWPIYDPGSGTVFYYELEEDETRTLCCVVDGDVEHPQRIIENAGFPVGQWKCIESGALQFDEGTGRVFCWLDRGEENIQHIGAMYEIKMNGTPTAECIADNTSVLSWGIQNGKLYYIGDYSDMGAGDLYVSNGTDVSIVKNDIQAVIVRSKHYSYYYKGMWW